MKKALYQALFHILLLTGSIAAPSPGENTGANPLETQPTPFTTLIDFALLRSQYAKGETESLPVWLESIQIETTRPLDLIPHEVQSHSALIPHKGKESAIRIRLRALPGLSDTLLLRLIYDDKPGAPLTLTGWTETGLCLYTGEVPNIGLNVPTSETFKIPTQGIDYLEIRVSGDGSQLRQAFLTTLQKRDIHYALDFPPPPTDYIDPFQAPASAPTRQNDHAIFGRIKAPLESGIVRLTPTATAPTPFYAFTFDLQAQPLLATLSFDLHNAAPTAPLAAWINDTPLGPAAPHFPDLSDPAYTGVSRPFQSMSFIYAGWLKTQLPIPGQHLRKGENQLILQLPAGSGPAAIRSLEIQLKYSWRKLDYILAPTAPH